ncbi:MAG: PF20097 family protein [Butyricicoccus sp.]
MICPYCGKEMLDGRYVVVRDFPSWKAKLPGGRWGAPSIVLDGGLFHEDYASDSAYCLSCRVLITRPSEQAADKFQKKYNERMENLRERGEK